MTYQLSTSTLAIEVQDNGGWTLWDRQSDQRLWLVPAAPLCRPVFVGPASASAQFQEIIFGNDAITWNYRVPGCSNFQVSITREDDSLVFASCFVPEAAVALTRLEILPQDTGINMYDVVNFRNRHHTSHTWPELFLGSENCRTNTYSDDWQFAPHPSMLCFRKGTRHLLCGALDLSNSFGLHFAAQEYRTSDFFLDFGAEPHALPLAAGTGWSSPRFILMAHKAEDVHETIDLYSAKLIAHGLIPDPATKQRFGWHREPLYFTWIDQAYLAGTQAAGNLADQAARMQDADHELLQVMTEEFVLQAAEVLGRERLPIRTILLDDGWQVARGQWEPHPRRFSHLRRLVNMLHDQGFRVIVWWSWSEILDAAEVEDETLLHNADGSVWRNRHGARMRDYSHPATQEYLRQLFHTLFSSEPGCYDLDGVKTDFLADKVHPDMPLFDASWRGEENYMLRVTRFFRDEMRRHKPDACHVGCAGHPYLAEFIDINRTYDVFSSNCEEHLNRARMLAATTPGVPVAYDSHNFIEGYAEYFASAAAHGHSVQISNILGTRQDTFAAWQPANDEFYDLLRRGLELNTHGQDYIW